MRTGPALAYAVVIALTQAGSALSTAAQSVSIDLDKLSKVAYCAGVMKEEAGTLQFEKKLAEQEEESTNNKSEEIRRLAKTEVRVLRGYLSTQRRFQEYLLTRTSLFPKTATAIYLASEAGASDMLACLEKRNPSCNASGTTAELRDCVEPPQERGPCRRAWACDDLDLPY
jgi:hypothetical protein